jgi:amino acid transporter
LIITILYCLANVAYFAAIPADEIRTSKELTAALFFEKVFGTKAAKGLPALIAVSAAGNIMAVIIGSTRIMREAGRQGVIPWPHVWASTRPFGTPFAPILVKWFCTAVVILALPFGEAFDFLVDLRSYPDSVFLFLMVVGLYHLRWQRKKAGIPQASFRAWHSALILSALVCLFILIMPWYPPENPSGDSIWYATYCAVGLGIMASMVLYYYFWIKWLPKWRNESIRTETLVLSEDGSVTHRLRRIPNAELKEWDRTHDDAGNVYEDSGSNGDVADGTNLVKRVRVKGAATVDHSLENKA